MKKNINSKSILALFLCLIPVLDPYIITQVGSFDMRIVDAVLTVIAIVYILKNKHIPCIKNLFVFGILLLVLNFLSSLTKLSGSLATTLRVWVFWAFYCVIFTAAVTSADFSEIEKWVLRISVFSCVFMLIQFVCMLLGIEIWNGQLPFLPLSKYDGWSSMVDITGAIRVHSIFQEPSYFGVYLLPVAAIALQRNKFLHTILFAVCIILSTSTLAIGGFVIVLAWHILCVIRHSKSKKVIRAYIIGIIIIGTVGILACLFIPTIRDIFQYTVKKIINIFADLKNPRMGSTRIRLLGYIFLFKDYPLANMLVGVGINQYPIVFAEQVQYAYSNSVVTMILNSGLIGAVAFVSIGVLWFVKSSLPNKIFPIIFMFVMCSDQMLFNWYFFYLLMWVLFGLHASEKPAELAIIDWTNTKTLYKTCVNKITSFCSSRIGRK